MARKVYISSDMSVDDELSDIAEEINPLLSLLWPWFLTAFDDWGRAEASPKRLKNLVFPANELITIEIIKQALQAYNGRLITLYEVGGKWYMHIDPDKWFKYQTHIRREKREKDSSKYPAPPDDNAQMRADARESAQSSADNENRADADFTRVAQMRADARDYTPSPSPSLSPSPTKYIYGDGNRRDDPFSIFIAQDFGKLDEMTSEFIKSAIEDYSEEWVVRAMKIAVKSAIKTWTYVEGILKRWRAMNHPEPWTVEKEQPAPNVKQFKRGGRSDKPHIPIVEQHEGQQMTEEELAEALRLARELEEGA